MDGQCKPGTGSLCTILPAGMWIAAIAALPSWAVPATQLPCDTTVTSWQDARHSFIYVRPSDPQTGLTAAAHPSFAQPAAAPATNSSSCRVVASNIVNSLQGLSLRAHRSVFIFYQTYELGQGRVKAAKRNRLSTSTSGEFSRPTCTITTPADVSCTINRHENAEQPALGCMLILFGLGCFRGLLPADESHHHRA
jgi:hypothetical protein